MNARLALPLIALSLALTGCGNKGPLVLAEKPAAEPAAATAEPAIEPVAPESTIESSLDQEVDDAKSEVDGDG